MKALDVLSSLLRKQEHFFKLALDQQYREIWRLSNLRRYTPAVTDLLGVPFKISDGATFLEQYKSIVKDRWYDFFTQDDEPLIIDLGANVGLSVWFFKNLYPCSRVIAFEPDKDLFQILSENIHRLALENVELLNQAAWSSDGEVTFFPEGSDAGRVAIPLTCSNYTVKSASVRPWLSHRVAMLKIDIEGAETVVLEDLADLLKNVENLFLEYHSFAGQPQTLSVILTVLKDAGFRVDLRPCGGSPRPFVERKIISGIDCQVNIFGYRPS